MDFLIYVAVLGIIGIMKVNQTRDVSDSVGIVTEDVVEVCELPIGNNLALKRGNDAYTYILRSLRLKY